MSDKWDGKSKGTVIGYLIFIKVIKFFGIPTAYFILKFVTAWYFLFSKTPKENLKSFYQKIPIPQKGINSLVYRNFVYLGKCLIDRFAYLIDNKGKISYTEEGEEFLKELSNNPNGSMLISAHLGNWEIAGSLLKKISTKLNVVMFDGEAERLKNILKKTVGTPNFNIISIKNDLSHVFAIKNAMARGEMVCIHGDRFMEGSKVIQTEMFDQGVNLPAGPFQIPATLKVPYTIVFAIKTGRKTYHFSATKPKIETNSKNIADHFVSELEKKVVKHPEQWFNYHQFFKA